MAIVILFRDLQSDSFLVPQQRLPPPKFPPRHLLAPLLSLPRQLSQMALTLVLPFRFPPAVSFQHDQTSLMIQ